MKLHQVIMAILMFKSLDWLIVAIASDPDVSVGKGIAVSVVIWIVVWIAIWTIVELFMRSKLREMIDG